MTPRTHIPLVHKKKEPKVKSRLTRGGRIKPVSAKMAQINKIYRALKLKFLEEHPFCQHYIQEHGIEEKLAINLSGAGVFPIMASPYTVTFVRHVVPRATEVHHKRGRGKYHLDVSTWMAVSSEGHKKIHANTKESYKKGYMLPRND